MSDYLPPNPTDNPTDLARLLARKKRWRRSVWLTRWGMRLWAMRPLLWPSCGLLLLALLLVRFDLVGHMPLALHWLLLLAGIGTIIYGLIFLARISWPDERRILRAVERASQLPHRPLTSLQDETYHGPMAVLPLWQAHRARMVGLLTRLRAPKLLPLRLMPALLCFLLMVFLLPASGSRQEWQRLLQPPMPHGLVSSGAVQIWIEPPASTGLPPRLLNADSQEKVTQEKVTVPAHSILHVQVPDGWFTPWLQVNGLSLPLTAQTTSGYSMLAVLLENTELKLAQGPKQLARFAIEVQADEAPQIALIDAPELSARQTLRLHYRVSDDYGIGSITARLEALHPEQVSEKVKASPTLELVLPAPPRGTKPGMVELTSFSELAAWPYRGQEVRLTLTATDSNLQQSTTAPVVFSLPQREFVQPLARAIAEMRLDYLREPEAMAEAGGQTLYGLTLRPNNYDNNPLTHLAMRSAALRMVLDQKTQQAQAIQQQLWELALRLEEGGLASAESQLRRQLGRLQEMLKQAQALNPQALQKQLQQLAAALENYMQQLALQAPAAAGEAAGGTPGGKALSARDIQHMLNELAADSLTGARADALARTESLQALLEGLRLGGQEAVVPGLAQIQAITAAQHELMRKVEALAAASPLAANNKDTGAKDADMAALGLLLGESLPPLPQPPEALSSQAGASATMRSLKAEAKQQSKLAQTLQELEGLPQAAQKDALAAMQAAAGGLQQDLSGSALVQQARALHNLRQMQQQMLEQAKGAAGASAETLDPLGRASMVDMRGEGQAVKDEGGRRVARDILMWLRERVNDPSAPEAERRYWQRLLEPY